MERLKLAQDDEGARATIEAIKKPLRALFDVQRGKTKEEEKRILIVLSAALLKLMAANFGEEFTLQVTIAQLLKLKGEQ